MARLSCPRAFVAPIAVSALALAGVLTASAAPRTIGPVALMFPPWRNAARAVAAAASVGAVIRLGGVPFVAIVAPSTPTARAAHRQSDAWLLLDPARVTGCFKLSR